MKLLNVSFAVALACLTSIPAVAELPRSPKETIVEFVGAFSRHDIPALLSLTHPDLEWLTVSGSTVSVETRGRDALAASLGSYFKSCPTCQSTVEVGVVSGNFISAVETATWQSKGVQRVQASLSVYELVDGKIRRAWYYSATEP